MDERYQILRVEKATGDTMWCHLYIIDQSLTNIRHKARELNRLFSLYNYIPMVVRTNKRPKVLK